MKHTVFNGVPTYKQLEALHEKFCNENEKLKTIFADGYYITTRLSSGKYNHIQALK